MINAMLSTLKLTDVGSYSPWWCSAYGVIKWCVFKSYILPTVFFRFLSSLNYNYYSKLWLLLCICRSYLIGKTMQCPWCWVWPSARRFLNNVTAKIGLSPQTEVTKKKKKKTLVVQPFLFFSDFYSFLSLRALYFPFPCSFLGGFSGSFCFRLLVFSSVKRLQFSFGRFSKIQRDNSLQLLRLPLH